MENTTTPDGLKFLSAEIENFKGLTSKVVEIAGRSLVIIGGNAKDKSSFIQAILSPLNKDLLPPDPIKKGEKNASIRVTIGGNIEGEPVEYIASLYFTPSDKKGKLVLERADGEKVKNPSTVLKNLVGDISFDIFDFVHLDTKKKIEILKNLTGKREEIDLLSMKYKTDYDIRTDTNRKAAELEAQLLENAYTSDQIDRYMKSEPIEPIQKELSDIGFSISNYQKGKSRILDLNNTKESLQKVNLQYEKNIQEAKKAIESYRQLIAEKEVEITSTEEICAESFMKIISIQNSIAKGEEWLITTPEPKADEINKRLTDAMEHNKHHEKVQDYQKKHTQMITFKNEALKLTQALDKILKDKEFAIKNSKLPIEGLTFTDSEVFYNGLPLDDRQINKGKLIEIGFHVGAALNPNLKVAFINDGSLLDKHTLNAIIESAGKQNIQLMVEMVDFNGGDATIEFMEDFLINKGL